METDYRKLQHDIQSLIEGLADRLPADQLAGMQQASQAGEWTDALEHLCATLVKRRIAVRPEDRDALAAALDAFGWEDEEYYHYINHKASTIAALNVEG